jgi:hypothetical protein
MSADHRQRGGGESLDELLAALRKALERHKVPTRHEARPVLLALGAEIVAGRNESVDAAVRALHEIFPSSGPSSEAASRKGEPDDARRGSAQAAWSADWRAAVADELSMACTEFVRSVDPQHLTHPRYDFEYTLQARERLELRLRAAERLGLPLGEAWSSQVERADERLEAVRRKGRPGGGS